MFERGKLERERKLERGSKRKRENKPRDRAFISYFVELS